MNRETVTIRIEPKKKKALDTIAKEVDRDRSYVLNEAIDNYLEVHAWQIDHIQKGVRQADRGQFAKE
ncbi:MAG: ribbon-helix-helix protein, CopG family, partial [Elusimicrobia bacterium]|nr:ribbon-helix-helix protein, CopG family [Elusimicrobiota bacterium]